ncbi:MAG: hypothetical protein NC399_02865 [Muribaculum sp.]|nr:hypothetical protein [Muribaculum sp.]
MKNYNYKSYQDVSDMHHIGVDYNGNHYDVIFGRYMNGGFCAIPNWNTGCDLAGFDDVFWNTEALARALKSKKAAGAIASAIAEYAAVSKAAEEADGGEAAPGKEQT